MDALFCDCVYHCAFKLTCFNAVVVESWSWSGRFGLMVPNAFDFLGEVSKNLLLLFASAERAIVSCVL